MRKQVLSDGGLFQVKNNLRRFVRRLCLELLFWLIFILVFLVTAGNWTVWRRNSLALGYWSENSDLDITLFSKKNARPSYALIFLWKCFCRFGEWAVYTEEDRKWMNIANPLEISRDPILLRQCGLLARKPNGAEAFVFWLRMMDSDAFFKKNIRSDKMFSRVRKWSFHRKSVEPFLKKKVESTFPAYVEEIMHALSPVPAEDFLVNGSDAYLRPHRWLGEALFSGLNTKKYFQEASPLLLNIARAQVQWEVWGLLGQIRLRRNYINVMEHLENLTNLFPEKDEIHAFIGEFFVYLEQLRNSKQEVSLMNELEKLTTTTSLDECSSGKFE